MKISRKPPLRTSGSSGGGIMLPDNDADRAPGRSGDI